MWPQTHLFQVSLGWIKQEEVVLFVTLMADVAICRWWSLRRVLSLSVKYDAANWCKISRETTELFPLPSDFLLSFCLSKKIVSDSSP